MSFTANDQAAYNLFNRNCYRIPRNQRRYVWSKRNWQELFDDILLVANGIEKTHFIGSVVLYREKDRENGISYYTIVDGQQRITTLAILLSSIAFWLKCYSAESEFNGTKQYILARDDTDKDHVMVTSEFHVSIERIISSIVNTSYDVLKKQDIESFIDTSTFSTKDKNIALAFKFFLNTIKEQVEHSRKKPVNYLVGLRDIIINKIQYVSIIATSEEDACTVFEILNARGSVLEDHELLKNLIMRGIKPEDDIDIAKSTWLEIESELGSNIGRFVKHYATHRYRTGIQDGLSDYKIIQMANKGKSMQELLFDIKLKAKYYCKLINPVLEGEASNCSETEYHVYSFFKKHRQEQIRPVLLSLIHQQEQGMLSKEMYEEAILFLYDFFVCYNIIGQENSNKITNTIYTLSRELEENFSLEMVQRLISELHNKLPSRESFMKAFSLVGWSHHGGFYDDDKDKERVQIILEVLERHKNAGGRCSEFTIEHIYDDKDDSENGRIGNLVPLETQLNQKCSRKTFEEKLKIYSNSSFQMARNLSLYYSENPKSFSIAKRTDIMAEEFYDKVLHFSISDTLKEYEKQMRKKNSAPKTDNRTIEDIVMGRGYTGDKQISLFELIDNINEPI